VRDVNTSILLFGSKMIED